jgi:hypothetical protein
MLPVGFEPTISAGERPQTYLDRAATGTGSTVVLDRKIIYILLFTEKNTTRLSQLKT